MRTSQTVPVTHHQYFLRKCFDFPQRQPGTAVHCLLSHNDTAIHSSSTFVKFHHNNTQQHEQDCYEPSCIPLPAEPSGYAAHNIANLTKERAIIVDYAERKSCVFFAGVSAQCVLPSRAFASAAADTHDDFKPQAKAGAAVGTDINSQIKAAVESNKVFLYMKVGVSV